MGSLRAMDERFIEVGDVTLCYETFGDPSDPAMLLIMGLGTQMVGWHEDFCRRLASEGFHVIRFDNRDIGRSTHLRHLKPPTTLQLLTRSKSAAGYTLDDMADDAAGLLEGLGIEAAHLVGASMGGMIAQTVAVRHPQRVLSLASIMSTTGDPEVGRPTPEAMAVLMTRAPADREGYIRTTLEARAVIGSRPPDRDRILDLAGRAYERGYHPEGTARQFAAAVASPDRTPELGGLDVPTVVIHGAEDPLIGPSGGEATAAAIPGAELLVIDGMGHDLPRAVWPEVTDRITALVERAEKER